MKKVLLAIVQTLVCFALLCACGAKAATFSGFIDLQESYTAELGVPYTVPDVKFKMSDGKEHTCAVSVKDADGADVLIEYGTMIPQKLGTYKATFSAVFEGAKLSEKTVDVVVLDREAADITLSYESKIGFTGSVISLPTAEILDNSGEVLTPRYEVLLGETKIDITDENTFTPSVSGRYVINVYALDSSNNEGLATAVVEISELVKNKVMYFDSEFGLSQIKREGGRLEFNTDAKYNFGYESGSVKMFTDGSDEYIQMRWNMPAIKNLKEYKEMFFYVYNDLDVAVPYWNNWNTKDVKLQPKVWNKVTLWDDGTADGNWDSYFPDKDVNITCDATDITGFLISIGCPKIDGAYKGDFYFSSVNLIATPTVNEVIDLINKLPAELSLKDIGKVELANDTYYFLSAADKLLVTNASKLTLAKAAIVELQNVEKINKVDEAILGLPALDEYTLEFEKDLLAVEVMYKKLSVELQARVKNTAALTALLAKNKTLNDDATVDSMIALIAEIPEIGTISYEDDSEYIYMIRDELDSLSETLKARITNLEKFNEALTYIYSVEPAPNRIYREIADLPEVGMLSAAEKEKATALKDEYGDLTAEEKKIVKNIAKLEEILERMSEEAPNVAYNSEQPWIVDCIERNGGRFEYSTTVKYAGEKGSIYVHNAPEGGDMDTAIIFKVPQIKDIGDYYQIKFRIYNDSGYEAESWIDWTTSKKLADKQWSEYVITVANDGTININGIKAKTDNFANIELIFRHKKNAADKYDGKFYIGNVVLVPFTSAQSIVDEINALPKAEDITAEDGIKIIEIENKLVSVKFSEKAKIKDSIDKLTALKSAVFDAEKEQAIKNHIFFSSDYVWAKSAGFGEPDTGSVTLNKDAAFIHGTDKTSLKLSCGVGQNYPSLKITPFMTSLTGYDFVEFYVYSTIAKDSDAWVDWSAGITFPDGEGKIKGNAWTKIRINVYSITPADSWNILRIAEKGDFYVSSIIAGKLAAREGDVFYSADVSDDFTIADGLKGTVTKSNKIYYGSDKSSLEVSSKQGEINSAGLKIFPKIKVLDGYSHIEFFVFSTLDSTVMCGSYDAITFPDGEKMLKANKWTRIHVTVKAIREVCEYTDDFQSYDYWNVFKAREEGTYNISSFKAVKTSVTPAIIP